MVTAIVLAAGKSERMGQNKLLLPFGSKRVIEHTVDQLVASIVDAIVVVLGSKATEIKEIIGLRPVKTVYNPDYANGMSTSLSIGLQAISGGVSHVLVVLGDQPLVRSNTYDLLITKAQTNNKGLFVPTFQGKRGNPIVIASKFFNEVLRQSGDIGGRELLINKADEVMEVPVDDMGVLININTDDEYQKRLRQLAYSEGRNDKKG